MLAALKKHINFQELNTIFGALQNIVFGGIFGGKEAVTAGWGQMVLFPAATFFSILNFIYRLKTYLNEKNKSVGKTASILLAGASLITEVFAVSAAVAAYCGAAFLAAAAIPTIFFGMICTNLGWNLCQTSYHYFQYNSPGKGTFAKKAHKEAFQNHLRSSAVLGVMGGTICLLMMSPIALTMSAVIVVKSAAILVLTLNVAKILHTFHGMRNKRKQEELEKKMISIPPVPQTPKTKIRQLGQLFLNANKEVKPFNPLSTAQREQYKIHNFSLEEEVYKDLIPKMYAASNPKEFVLDLICQATQALEEDLSGRGEGFSKSFFMQGQREKRRDKLQMVQWMTELVQTGVVKLQNSLIGSFEDLEKQISQNMKRNIYASAFATEINEGKVHKLCKIVEHYMKNKDSFNLKPEPNSPNRFVAG